MKKAAHPGKSDGLPHHFVRPSGSHPVPFGQTTKPDRERTRPNMSNEPLSRDLAAVLESIGRRVAETAEREKAAVPEPKPPAKILQFPLPFGDDTRAVSNSMARCPLFAAVKERQFFKDYVTAGKDGACTIEFAGEQLNQDDHDTLMQLVRMAVHKPFGEDVRVSVNSALLGLGRSTHAEQRRQFFEQISRIVRLTVRLTLPGLPRYEGHFVNDASTPQDQATLPRFRRHLTYSLNSKFSRFFNQHAYTLFDWQERVSLKGRGSELAKWLHLWIIGNADQYPHKVETLHRLSGSRDKTLKSFRQNLRQALGLLKDAKIIADWRIDPEADLVHIDRTPSPAQLQHQARKVRKPRKP